MASMPSCVTVITMTPNGIRAKVYETRAFLDYLRDDPHFMRDEYGDQLKLLTEEDLVRELGDLQALSGMIVCGGPPFDRLLK